MPGTWVLRAACHCKTIISSRQGLAEIMMGLGEYSNISIMPLISLQVILMVVAIQVVTQMEIVFSYDLVNNEAE